MQRVMQQSKFCLATALSPPSAQLSAGFEVKVEKYDLHEGVKATTEVPAKGAVVTAPPNLEFIPPGTSRSLVPDPKAPSLLVIYRREARVALGTWFADVAVSNATAVCVSGGLQLPGTLWRAMTSLFLAFSVH